MYHQPHASPKNRNQYREVSAFSPMRITVPNTPTRAHTPVPNTPTRSRFQLVNKPTRPRTPQRQQSIELRRDEEAACPFCHRCTQQILCRACGHCMLGRVRGTCSIHIGIIHLMDVEVCPKCRSSSLKEFAEFGGLPVKEKDIKGSPLKCRSPSFKELAEFGGLPVKEQEVKRSPSKSTSTQTPRQLSVPLMQALDGDRRQLNSYSAFTATGYRN